MRNGLEQLARIEAYLSGQLPDVEAFQEEMSNDASLRSEVQILGELIQTIQKQGIQIEIARARTTYRLLRALRWLGTALAFCLALMVATLLYINLNKENGNSGPQIRHDLPDENEIGSTEWIQADSALPTLVYTLRANRDEVIETPGGILISIPQGSLLQKNGEPLTGTYELEVKEALDAAGIMKAGLSTWSDDRLLETGGMFYVNMRQNGENLQIAKDAGITASIPKQQNRNDMQLFDGIRTGDYYIGAAEAEEEIGIGNLSHINWVNPHKPITDLVPIPMAQLNFYPPGFETKLSEAGYPDRKKEFKDSVYLSFRTESEREATFSTDGGLLFQKKCSRCHNISHERFIGPGLKNVRQRWESIDRLTAWVQNPNAYLGTGDMYAINLYEKYNKNSMPGFALSKEQIVSILDFIDYSQTGINPVTVLAFWNEEFDGTLLASKEFETRMRYIHSTCDERILECYTLNMDSTMFFCDSLAAQRSYGEQQLQFLKFKSQKYGKPKNGKVFSQTLLSIFAQKQRELDAAYNRTTGAWFLRQVEADRKAQKNYTEQRDRDTRREMANFNRELTDNLCEAKRQLGRPCDNNFPVSRNVRENFNTFSLQSTGWKNVDAYVMEATFNRNSMEYTDPVTGQKAKLTYSAINVTLKNADNYAIREAYLIPSGKLSFMRMNKQDGRFTESLNSLLQYHLVVVGYKGADLFLYTAENITAGDISVNLKASTADLLNRFINRNGSQPAVDDMRYELQSLNLQSAEIKRKAQRAERSRLREMLWPIVYPCRYADSYPSDSLSMPMESSPK